MATRTSVRNPTLEQALNTTRAILADDATLDDSQVRAMVTLIVAMYDLDHGNLPAIVAAVVEDGSGDTAKTAKALVMLRSAQ